MDEQVQHFRAAINDIYTDISSAYCDSSDDEDEERLIFEEALHSAEDIELEMMSISSLETTQDPLALTKLHGGLLCAICYLQKELETADYYSTLVKLEEITEFWNQSQECIWLYTYAKYHQGKFILKEIGNPSFALKEFLMAERNIKEYEITYGDFNQMPYELEHILQNPDHEMDCIFSDFVTLHMKLQIKILICAKLTRNEEVIMEHGVDGIRAAFTLDHHRYKTTYHSFFASIEYVAEVFMSYLKFKQAAYLITFLKYLIETLDAENQDMVEGIYVHEVAHMDLIVDYADEFLSAILEYRMQGLQASLDDLNECDIILDEDTIKKYNELPCLLDADDESIKKLLNTARSYWDVLNPIKTDDDRRSNYSKRFDEIEEKLFEVSTVPHFETNMGVYRNGINALKLKFRRLFDNPFLVANAYQKFCWLATIEDEARTLLKSVGVHHILYEEVASLTCAIGLILVNEFYADDRHSSKLQSVLDHCESVTESLRLLPSGLVLFMSTQYFQAKNILRIKSASKDQLSFALQLLLDAKIAYEEYQGVNFELKPRDLLQNLLFPNQDPTSFTLVETIELPILVAQIRYSIYKAAVQLQNFDLIKSVCISGIRAAIHLYRHDKVGPVSMINALINLSYELLEHEHVSQANHLIAIATFILRGPIKRPLAPKENLDLIRLCYYHTLICKSMTLIDQATEQKAKKQKLESDFYDKITDEITVVEEETLHPVDATTNIDEINVFFTKARELIGSLSNRTSNNKETAAPSLVNDIKVHLDKKYEELNGGDPNKENIPDFFERSMMDPITSKGYQRTLHIK